MSTFQASLIEVESVTDYKISSEHDTVIDLNYSTLGIDNARDLKEGLYRKIAGGKTRMVIIRCCQITVEAQNALLKVCEEPPPFVHILIVAPRGIFIIPTLRSRLSVEVSEMASASNQEFIVFEEASYRLRLEQIELAHKQKDSVWYESIKRGLLISLRKGELRDCLHEVNLVVNRLLTRGASNKMLLEQLALILPIRTNRK